MGGRTTPSSSSSRQSTVGLGQRPSKCRGKFLSHLKDTKYRNTEIYKQVCKNLRSKFQENPKKIWSTFGLGQRARKCGRKRCVISPTPSLSSHYTLSHANQQENQWNLFKFSLKNPNIRMMWYFDFNSMFDWGSLGRELSKTMRREHFENQWSQRKFQCYVETLFGGKSDDSGSIHACNI